MVLRIANRKKMERWLRGKNRKREREREDEWWNKAERSRKQTDEAPPATALCHTHTERQKHRQTHIHAAQTNTNKTTHRHLQFAETVSYLVTNMSTAAHEALPKTDRTNGVSPSIHPSIRMGILVLCSFICVSVTSVCAVQAKRNDIVNPTNTFLHNTHTHKHIQNHTIFQKGKYNEISSVFFLFFLFIRITQTQKTFDSWYVMYLDRNEEKFFGENVMASSWCWFCYVPVMLYIVLLYMLLATLFGISHITIHPLTVWYFDLARAYTSFSIHHVSHMQTHTHNCTHAKTNETYLISALMSIVTFWNGKSEKIYVLRHVYSKMVF